MSPRSFDSPIIFKLCSCFISIVSSFFSSTTFLFSQLKIVYRTCALQHFHDKLVTLHIRAKYNSLGKLELCEQQPEMSLKWFNFSHIIEFFRFGSIYFPIYDFSSSMQKIADTLKGVLPFGNFKNSILWCIFLKVGVSRKCRQILKRPQEILEIRFFDEFSWNLGF